MSPAGATASDAKPLKDGCVLSLTLMGLSKDWPERDRANIRSEGPDAFDCSQSAYMEVDVAKKVGLLSPCARISAPSSLIGIGESKVSPPL